MFDRFLHMVGTAVQGTPLEEPLDRTYYRITGPRRVKAELGDVTAEFNARSSSEYYSVQDLGGESEVVKAMLDELSTNDVVWDVGAFVGWHAALFGQVAETVAFEADPDTYRKLQEACTLNPRARVTPICLGLGNPSQEWETVAIAAGEGGAVTTKSKGGRATTIASPATMIDSVLTRPTAMKLDVQGLEGEVIEGFGEYLADLRLLLVEFHEGRIVGDWTAESLHERITDTGFELLREQPRREDVLKLYQRP